MSHGRNLKIASIWVWIGSWCDKDSRSRMVIGDGFDDCDLGGYIENRKHPTMNATYGSETHSANHLAQVCFGLCKVSWSLLIGFS